MSWKKNSEETARYLYRLELQPGATAAEIKAAYRRLIKDYHPDTVATLPKKFQEFAAKQAIELREAYDLLIDTCADSEQRHSAPEGAEAPEPSVSRRPPYLGVLLPLQNIVASETPHVVIQCEPDWTTARVKAFIAADRFDFWITEHRRSDDGSQEALYGTLRYSASRNADATGLREAYCAVISHHDVAVQSPSGAHIVVRANPMRGGAEAFGQLEVRESLPHVENSPLVGSPLFYGTLGYWTSDGGIDYDLRRRSGARS